MDEFGCVENFKKRKKMTKAEKKEMEKIYRAQRVDAALAAAAAAAVPDIVQDQQEFMDEAVVGNSGEEEEDDDANQEDEDEVIATAVEAIELLPTVAASAPSLSAPSQGAIAEVRHFQNVDRRVFASSNVGRRVRLARATTWVMEFAGPYRDINMVTNAEVTARAPLHPDPNAKDTADLLFTLNPNIPQFCRTHLDRYFLPPQLVRFNVQYNEFKATYLAPSRNVESALLSKLAANVQCGFLPPTSAPACSSGSQLHQTKVYTHAAARTGEPKIILLSLYSDGAALNTSAPQSLHPIDLEITYEGAVRCAHFERTRACVCFAPTSITACMITRNGGAITWAQVSSTDRSQLTRLMHKRVHHHVLAQLVDICKQVYNFAHPALGKVRFQLAGFTGDGVERASWSGAKGCPTCVEDQILIVGNHHFRSLNRPGEWHEDGLDVSAYSEATFSGDGLDLFGFPDLMVMSCAHVDTPLTTPPTAHV